MKYFIFLIMLLCSNITNSKEILYQKGMASWYGYQHAGKLCADGKNRFNPKKLTAAHKKLPFGTKVKVFNPKNKKSVSVTITDRGPFVKGRIIDLSKKAAEILDINGIGMVQLKIVK